MKTTTGRRAALSTAMIAALTLAACGGGEDEETAEGPGGEEIQIGEQLDIAITAQPPTLEPHSNNAHLNRIHNRLIFEQLIAFDEDLEPQPVLAESYDFDDDATTLTFQLREDVQFHNGEEMTADDVIASLNRWAEESVTGSTYFGEADIGSPEEGVVTIELPEPNMVAPILLSDPFQQAMIVPESVVDDVETGEYLEGENLVGTGPYTFGDWVTDQYLVFERFEDYNSPEGESSGMAGEKQAYFEEIYVHFVADDATRLAGLQTNEYDVIDQVPHDNYEQAEGDDDIEIVLGESGIAVATINQAQGPMTDVNMRRALRAAVDINEVGMGAYGNEEFYHADSPLFPEETQWYVEPEDEQMEEWLEADPELAGEYLEEAGYDGEEVRILVTSDYADSYGRAVVMQDNLEDAGVETDLVVYDWPTVQEMTEDETAYEITLTNFNLWPAVPSTFSPFQASGGGWPDTPSVFEAATDLTSAEDDEGIDQAMGDLFDAYWEELPTLSLGGRSNIMAHGSHVDGAEWISGVGEVWHHIHEVD